jgi:hypothetical protein
MYACFIFYVFFFFVLVFRSSFVECGMILPTPHPPFYLCKWYLPLQVIFTFTGMKQGLGRWLVRERVQGERVQEVF